MSKTKELHFEDAIEVALLDNGWSNGDPKTLDRATGLFVDDLVEFVRSTQTHEWDELVTRYPSEDDAIIGLAKRVAKELDNPGRNGVVDLLRNGVTDLGVNLRLAFFRPAHSITEDLEVLYGLNNLSVVRQLDVGSWKHAAAQQMDLVLVLNGIPVATAELKNPQTNQNLERAISQYRNDRDPVNPILRRCVVHFAVDPDRVAMTTALTGQATEFLPFNRGNGKAAGNPLVEGKHRTHYLWEDVWQRDAWMNLLQKFVHTETDQDTKQRRTIFPRFHQWDAVNVLVNAARQDGPGASYLIEHSAGSGKSNTIAWTAHQLSNLHDADNNKVFDKVLVITDRLVLDNALGSTVHQFENVHGVVHRIDSSEGAKSAALADALTNPPAKIVVCTIQTFGFVLDRLRDNDATLADKNFAVLVDEAHSSQTGSAAASAKEALNIEGDNGGALEAAEAEELAAEAQTPDAEDRLAELVKGRGKQSNLSYFAFTATPKAKTREMFGRPVTRRGDDGVLATWYESFHLYSMRQAIEEKFILDVLADYTTYNTFWKIEKTVRDDPEFDERKAKAAIARFVTLHPTNLAQKSEIIIEHFRQKVANRIGGRAKAMVVTSSRLHAVRYKQALDKYLAEHGYSDIATIVAFSGKVIDKGLDHTEASMNGFPSSQIVQRFDTADYQIMIVAEKFQTGFDQPLLHTMYVDKPLHGLAAVQTLSRLNRRHAGKDNTFVLDFRNDAEDITDAFAPYYEGAVAKATDPNLMSDTRDKLRAVDVIRPDDVTAFAEAFVSDSAQAHALTEAALNPAVDRFSGNLDEDQQEAFRDDLRRFTRVYAFLSQVATWTDLDLEQWYIYCRALSLKLKNYRSDEGINVSDKVELTHLRALVSWEGDAGVEEPVTEVEQMWGDRVMTDDEREALSVIVRDMNEKFGQELTDEHRLTLDQYTERFGQDGRIVEAARANDDYSTFEEIAFEPVFLDTIISQMDANEEIFKLILADDGMRAAFARYVGRTVYENARANK